MQFAFNKLVSLFKRVGLVMNTKKTEVMIGIPGRIHTAMTQIAYNNRLEGYTNMQVWHSRRVTCNICNADLTAGSLRSYLESQHGVFRILCSTGTLPRSPASRLPTMLPT